MGKLNTTVHVNGVAYGPGKDIPADIAALISNPDVWQGKPPAGAGSAVKPQQTLQVHVTVVDPEPAAQSPASTGDDEPPRSGAGSSTEAWAEYAKAKGIEVPDDAGRDEIIAAVEGAKQQ